MTKSIISEQREDSGHIMSKHMRGRQVISKQMRGRMNESTSIRRDRMRGRKRMSKHSSGTRIMLVDHK
jgi:hypothetical protein